MKTKWARDFSFSFFFSSSSFTGCRSREYNGILKFNFTAIGQFPPCSSAFPASMLSLDQGVDPFPNCTHSVIIWPFIMWVYSPLRRMSNTPCIQQQPLVYKMFQGGVLFFTIRNLFVCNLFVFILLLVLE